MYKKLTILFLLLMPTMVMGARDTRSELGKRKAEASPAGEPSAQRPMSYFSEESIDSYISQEITLGVSAEDLEAFQQELSQSNYSNASWSDNQSLSFHLYEDSSRNSVQPISSAIVSSEDLEAFQQELSRDASEWSNSQSASFQSFNHRDELERSDLTELNTLAQELLAEEVLAEEAAHHQFSKFHIKRMYTGTTNITPEPELGKTRYFCPECFDNFICIQNVKQVRHDASCSLKQGFKTKHVLTVVAPIVVKNKLGDIYNLHPVRGTIYLQNSNGLDENKIIANADGSFAYNHAGNIRFWDKLGFDVVARRRITNTLNTNFEIISRKPADEEREYFECPESGCAQLHENRDYKILVKHLKAVHKWKKPYICHYKDCKSSYDSKGHLFDYHEVKHLGIEFCCPACFEYQKLETNLKYQHIKKQHPELIL